MTSLVAEVASSNDVCTSVFSSVLASDQMLSSATELRGLTMRDAVP
jgi:hypothetical protein